MQKVLIANQNVEQNNALCQHLSKDKRLEIIGITDGTTTLEKYLEIQPNILVIDSCMQDINYIDLINRLSTNIKEKRNCNIILTARKDEKLKISHVSRIYEVIYDNENNFEDLSKTIN